MNSGIYLGTIAHVRRAVTGYKFQSRMPWWLLDLDEVDTLSKKFWGFRRGNFSFFSFRDHDHINLGQRTAKDNVLAWAQQNGVTEPITKVLLLTNLRTLGYVFNPVSFYFLQGATQRWVVTEVGNTFWEQKPTLLGPFTGERIVQQIPKLFYISPFLSLENSLTLDVSWPAQTLRIHIDDRSPQDESELVAVFTGERQEITQAEILKLAVGFPFLCIGIIAAIHWHALKLWLKGVPFFSKNDRRDLQQGVFVWKSRKFVKR